MNRPDPRRLKAIPTVYSYYFPELRSLVSDLTRRFPHDVFLRSMDPGLDDFHEPVIEKFLSHQQAAVPDLRKFRHRYPTAGAEEAIREFMTELSLSGEERVYTLEGDYEGYRAIAETRGLTTVEAKLNDDPWELPPGTWFLSNPSARNGNFLPEEFVPKLCDAGHKIFYDLSYLGSTPFHRYDLSHPNIVAATVDFSKPYGLFYYRIGFTFSRRPITVLHANKWFKNIFSLLVADKVMDSIGPMELPMRYRPVQKRILERVNAETGLGLKPSDSLLVAWRDSVGLSAAQAKALAKFKRARAYRLCLTPYFLELERKAPISVAGAARGS
ncbi:MAG: hypothetical protein WC728_17470 [Elusimicrobiota bacterium]